MARPKIVKKIKTRNHFVHVGDLLVTDYAQVGGDLTVDGNLTLKGPLFCLGRIKVNGSLVAVEVMAGQGIEVSGDLEAHSLLYVYEACSFSDGVEEVARQIATFSPGFKADTECVEDALELISDPATLEELDSEGAVRVYAVQVSGSCILDGPLHAYGGVAVGGHFSPDECYVQGHIEAGTVCVDEGDLDCYGLDVESWVRVAGDLTCTDVSCSHLEVEGSVVAEEAVVVHGGDTMQDNKDAAPYRSKRVEAGTKSKGVLASLRCSGLKAGSVSAGGSILVDGRIECTDGYLRAGRSITASEKISSAKDFGILAGLDVARSLWLKDGYVCAPSKPQRLLTGAYRSIGKRRPYSDPKPTRLK